MSYATPQTTGTTAPYGSTELPHDPAHVGAAPPQYPVAGVVGEQGHNEKTAVPQQGQPQLQAQPQAQGQTYATATPLASLQSAPTPVDCPSCGVRALTNTEYKAGGTTHLAALLFCCVACLGCVPYIAGWFKDVEHKCGNCGALLAVWHKSGRTEVVQHEAVKST